MEAEELRLAGRSLADRYELEEEVASGGMGAVWRARDRVLRRPVAVKVLHEHLARDPDLLDRFHVEAVAAARLTHPAVVRVFDTGIDAGVCFIVMELFEGRTLESVLASRGPLEAEEAVRIVRRVLDGLAHAHREGVIHRDVKPANILVAPDGFVKVTDFGIAKAAFAGDDLTTTGNLLGTARYLAPEQVTGEPVDARTDLYASGIVLYECLTGRVPFEADTHIATATLRLTQEVVPPRALRSGIPRGLDAVAVRALSLRPDDRYGTAEEMAEALDRAVPSWASPAPAGPAEVPEQASPSVRSWVAVPLLVLLVAALAVGAFWVLGQVLDEDGQAPTRGGGTDAPRTLDAAAIDAYDPEGGDGEHDETVTGATDGDPGTYWTTEGYENPDMDKTGVGIILELAEPSEVTGLRIETDTPGFDFSVYASDSPDTWATDAEPLAEATADADAQVTVGPVETRYLLLWLTELPLVDNYRAHVNEVEVLGP